MLKCLIYQQVLRNKWLIFEECLIIRETCRAMIHCIFYICLVKIAADIIWRRNSNRLPLKVKYFHYLLFFIDITLLLHFYFILDRAIFTKDWVLDPLFNLKIPAAHILKVSSNYRQGALDQMTTIEHFLGRFYIKFMFSYLD
jgi:hypothetical protein